jgi:hypothetical protein
MERWMALTITLGALAKNMQDIINDLEKEVGPVEVDFVYISNGAANVKLKHGWEEFSEKMGPDFKRKDYDWARYIETRYGDFYEEKTKEEDDG